LHYRGGGSIVVVDQRAHAEKKSRFEGNHDKLRPCRISLHRGEEKKKVEVQGGEKAATLSFGLRRERRESLIKYRAKSEKRRSPFTNGCAAPKCSDEGLEDPKCHFISRLTREVASIIASGLRNSD